MSFKLSQVAIVLVLAAVSTQRRIATVKVNKQLHHGVDFNEVLQHLKLHSSDHHESHSTEPASDGPATNIVNIQNLNLQLGQLANKLSGKVGRGLTKVDSNAGLGSEVQQLLNELEFELGNTIDKEDSLRCVGDRCGGEADRCGTGLRCGCQPRSEDQDDDDNEDRQVLRCNDLRCGCRPRSEDRDEEGEERQQLRCRGTRCGQTTRFDDYLKTELERYGKKYKINEELDAIVLDLDNFNGLLGRLNKKRNGRNKKSSEINKSPNANSYDMDYLFSVDENVRSKKKTRPVVINLNHYDDDEELDQEIENTLHRLKSNGDPLRQKMSAEFEKLLESLKVSLQKLGANASQKQMLELLRKLLHLDADIDSGEVLRVKQLFPLTTKQKLKLLKKNPITSSPRRAARSPQGFGVPFEMQVDGLAQVQA